MLSNIILIHDISRGLAIVLVISVGLCCCVSYHFGAEDKAFVRASENGCLANEGLTRSRNFVKGWLETADPKTGLIARNLKDSKDIWNAKDSAADNYPFMVLTAAITE